MRLATLASIAAAAAAAAAVTIAAPALAGTPALVQDLRHDPARVPVGATYVYEKSNVDGTHAGRVAVHVAAADRIQSFKWTPGSDRATVVTAWIDWKRFSVARFETGHLFADGTYASRVELTTEGERLVARSGDMELAVDVERWPWHSYDFDLASLAFVWPHRTRPEEPFRFGVTDFGTTADGASGLVDKGWVTVEYAGRATREGHACREYAIDGPGLEDRGGRIWFRADDGALVDYEIDLPDEDGYESGKLRLLSTERLSAEAWEAFKRAKVGGSPAPASAS